MTRELSKAEVGLIGQVLGAIAIEGFRELITKRVIDAFISSYKNTNVAFDFNRSKPDPGAIDYLKERQIILSDKSASVLEGNLKYELLQGLQNNESIDQIKRRLDTIFTGNMVNTERIARTEVLNAQNSGRLSAYQQSGVVEYKMWQAAVNNARTAADSKRLHGQIQKLSDPFVDPKTGDACMHPPNRPNCRCTLLPLTRLPDKVITTDGQMYAADKKLGKIEINIGSLSKDIDTEINKNEREVWVRQTAKRAGHWRTIKIKGDK